MPENDRERFRTDLTIALSLVRQRRPWIFRDLSNRDRSKAETARAALIGEIMAMVADYELRKVGRSAPWHSTPPLKNEISNEDSCSGENMHSVGSRP